jgi:hypothetical protein
LGQDGSKHHSHIFARGPHPPKEDCLAMKPPANGLDPHDDPTCAYLAYWLFLALLALPAWVAFQALVAWAKRQPEKKDGLP